MCTDFTYLDTILILFYSIFLLNWDIAALGGLPW